MTMNIKDPAKNPALMGALNPAPAHTPPPKPVELGPTDATKVGEPENAAKQFSTASGSFAIVDAALLKGMEDNPLVQKAVVFPTKGEVAFEVTAEYDDAVLRSLSMSPMEDPSDAGRIVPPEHESHGEDGTSAEVVPPDMASPVAPSVAQQPVVPEASSNIPPKKEEPPANDQPRKVVGYDSKGNLIYEKPPNKVDLYVPPKALPEGASPLSHDSSPERAIRKHMTPRSRRHMGGSDRYRKNSPVKKVMARLKRPSRHQPDVEEAFSFITKFGGKKVTEDVIKSIKNQSLLAESIGLLMAMSMNGWQTLEEGVTNGTYEIVDDRLEADKAGYLLFNNKALPLDFNWLYEVRTMLQKSITESALGLGNAING